MSSPSSPTLRLSAPNEFTPAELDAVVHPTPFVYRIRAGRKDTEGTSQGVNGSDDGPFATDVITHPESAANPWQSWLRLTGFDFFPDGERAAVRTWMGDVWIVAGNQSQPGGFYRVRYTGKPALQPIGLHFEKGMIRVEFSDPVDASAGEATRYSVKAWNLKRSANYGSPHVDEHPLAVDKAEVVGPKTVKLSMPKLHTTMCIEIVCKLKQPDGTETERVIHATIHVL